MLLLGEPGLGKTYFAKRLAHVLATGFEFVSMSSLTAGWVLTGASAQWHNARPGKVAQTLIEGEYANPVVVLDEVDKAGGDARYDPMGALYGLLERDTATHFKDEYIDVDIDASHILWVATANDESSIPEPILNRMNVYAIERPDADGSRADRARRVSRDRRRASLAVPAGAVAERARAACVDPAARHAQAAARRVRHRTARRPRSPGCPRTSTAASCAAAARASASDAATSPRRTSYTSRGQLLCSSRDSARSASTTPPVWQRGQ